MELYVWESEAPLYSFDPHCLQVLAVLKLTNAPVAVTTCSNPRLSPSGELPFLKDGDNLVAGPWAIIHYLKRKGYDADSSLSKRDKGRSIALWQLLESRLGALMAYDRFHGDGYYATRAWMSKRLPFPLQYTVPRMLRATARGRYLEHMDVQSLLPTPATHSVSKPSPIETSAEFMSLGSSLAFPNGRRRQASAAPVCTLATQLTSRAIECLNGIARRYTSGGLFMFGQSPSTVDAILYGYVVFAVNCTMPECTATLQVLETENLAVILDACKRFSSEAMPENVHFLESSDIRAHNDVEFIRRDTEDEFGNGYVDRDDHEDDSGWRVQAPLPEEEEKERKAERVRAYQTYAVAGLAMLSYAVASGIKAVQAMEARRASGHGGKDTDDEDDEDYYSN